MRIASAICAGPKGPVLASDSSCVSRMPTAEADSTLSTRMVSSSWRTWAPIFKLWTKALLSAAPASSGPMLPQVRNMAPKPLAKPRAALWPSLMTLLRPSSFGLVLAAETPSWSTCRLAASKVVP